MAQRLPEDVVAPAAGDEKDDHLWRNGYAWAVHRAYRNALKQHDFDTGDILYSSDEARERGLLEQGDAAIQIISAPRRGEQEAVRLDLYRDSWNNSETIDTTAGKLLAFLRTGDPGELDHEPG